MKAALPTPTEIASFVDATHVVDVVKTETGLCLCVVNGNGSAEIVPFVKESGGIWLVPMKDKWGVTAKDVIALPERPEKYGTQEELVEEMVAFVHRYFDCSPEWEWLIAHYALLTWVYEAFSSVPYLRFLNDSGSGKTRALRVTHALCARAIMTMGATTASPIFRLVEKYKGTLVIDEADWSTSDLRDALIQILNTGYASNGIVWRSEKEGGGFEPRPFSTFGPKVIANRERFNDDALETRCLTVDESERDLREDIARQLPKAFESESQALRNKLLAWRQDHLRAIEVDETELRKLDPRSCEVGVTLWAISRDERFREWLLGYLADRSRDTKENKLRTRIARAIIRSAKPDQQTPYSEVIEAFEISNESGDILTPRMLGVYVKSLGISKGKLNRGHHTLKPTSAEINRLNKRYGDLG